MVLDRPHDPARLALAAVDRLADCWPDQIDHHYPAGLEDVNMSGPMVIGADHDPETAAA
jgi:hypothetical protein